LLVQPGFTFTAAEVVGLRQKIRLNRVRNVLSKRMHKRRQIK